MEKRLALITGGTSGIGLGTAKALAGKFDLALAYAENHEKAFDAAAQLNDCGSEVKIFVCKLDGYQSAKQLYDRVVADFGRQPEILVNSAGRIMDGFFYRQISRFRKSLYRNILSFPWQCVSLH